jgi:hypothetical protein
MKNPIRIILLAATCAALLSTHLRANENAAPVKPATSEEALGFILDKAKQYTEAGENALAKAVAAAQVEAPKILEEYLEWKFFKFVALTGFGALLFVVGVCALLYTITSFRKKAAWVHDGSRYEPMTGVGVLTTVLGIISTLAGGITFGVNLGTFLQIWLAPRVFLLESAANLIR